MKLQHTRLNESDDSSGILESTDLSLLHNPLLHKLEWRLEVLISIEEKKRHIRRQQAVSSSRLLPRI